MAEYRIEREVVGDLVGKAALLAVRDFVRDNLKLAVGTDKESVVRYWDSEWSNAPASMVLAESGAWNGTFRTNLGNALKMRTRDEVKAASGTGVKTGTGTGTTTTTVTKLGVIFGDDSTARVILGKLGDEDSAQVVYDAAADVYTIPGAVLSVYSKKLGSFASDVRKHIMDAVELDEATMGAIKAGWSYNGKFSDKTAELDAATDILAQFASSGDMSAVMELAPKIATGQPGLTKVGDSRKIEWVAAHLPAPEPEPEPEPEQPSEEPQAPADVIRNGADHDSGQSHVTTKPVVGRSKK